ncbi:hypothetical protein Bbelb_080370 [Branchiostoma belcheri]|nr:hypothetical protein Bbelb_080370 [Branchiostoma belcheri]
MGLANDSPSLPFCSDVSERLSEGRCVYTTRLSWRPKPLRLLPSLLEGTSVKSNPIAQLRRGRTATGWSLELNCNTRTSARGTSRPSNGEGGGHMCARQRGLLSELFLDKYKVYRKSDRVTWANCLQLRPPEDRKQNIKTVKGGQGGHTTHAQGCFLTGWEHGMQKLIKRLQRRRWRLQVSGG